MYSQNSNYNHSQLKCTQTTETIKIKVINPQRTVSTNRSRWVLVAYTVPRTKFLMTGKRRLTRYGSGVTSKPYHIQAATVQNLTQEKSHCGSFL